ncbi:ABC transporter ATP-binding protein [Halomonas beimenensis]|uniref:Nitrous oxide reductase maturation protein NosF (ATPase) n=1 Tax=Halomonas beimenensis TaxID=475662 RepID=A0A291PCL6_9GAMM|nr:ABC transporter ATP-binding protein [Halomonas beimenensis]ATJ84608.1 nitrous oxide reductase maturation protein NosF (ATPase) [Halomonas beimenensis]
MRPIIELHDVSLRQGGLTRLAGLDLAVEEGEVLALLGHNGAGKTTTMKLILGLLTPSAGRLEVLGGRPDGRHAAVLRRHLGYLPENVSFYEQLTGREVLHFFARLKRAAAGQAEELLERVGLATAAGRRVKTYSKGMRQRLGLAQALLGAPRLLLLDEPTTGLDPAATRDFYDTVRELGERGCTVLLSSHVLPGVEPYIDRALILGDGHRLALGSLDGLRTEAALPLTIRARGRLADRDWRTTWEDARIVARPLNGHEVSLSVPAECKLAVLRRLTAIPGVEDIELQPPSLETLYAHFSRLGTRERRGDAP